MLGPDDADVKISVFWGTILPGTVFREASDRAIPQNTDFIFVTPPEPNLTVASFGPSKGCLSPLK